ncbi:MAG: ATP-binding protein [Acidobacteriota bacterium]|nr:ATP-binding protein [Acidobacteriota bacterium]
MSVTCVCRECGAEFGYEPSASPLVVGFRPQICNGCAAAADAERIALAADAERALRGVPPRYEGASFASFAAHTPSQRLALELLRDRAGEGVMLIGDAGCGKTHLACAAISVGPPGSLFANTTTLLDDVRRGFGGEGQGLFARALSAPLLALDDLGSEAVTDWVRDRLYALINHRWDHCLPLLVTTNVLAADLAERIGQGVTSRIAGCCAHRIRVQGPDGRRRRAET